MGLTINTVHFLLHFRQQGVSFTRTATLGRQWLYVGEAQLGQALAQYGLSAPPARQILEENGGYAEPFFQVLGAGEVTSFDASDYEKAAVIHDMNTPVDEAHKNRFDAVLDGGTLEHIFNFPIAIKNAMEMVKVGGHFVGTMPSNNFLGHGFYQFSPELLFRIFTGANGYEPPRVFLLVDSHKPGRSWKKKWFEVKDPNAVGDRVTLRNAHCTMLYVIAKRLEERPIFARTPQQSDYENIAWKQPLPQSTRTIRASMQNLWLRCLYKLTPLLGISKKSYFEKVP